MSDYYYEDDAVQVVDQPIDITTQAEQSVLASLLVNNAGYDNMAGMLTAAMFENQSHGLVYSAIESLIANGKRADFISVAEELERHGALDRVGGVLYLRDLVTSLPLDGGAAIYGRVVANKAMKRHGVAMAHKIITELCSGQDPADVLSRASGELEDLTRRSGDDSMTMTAAELASFTLARMEKLYQQGESGSPAISTGITALDQKLCGGLYPGNLIIIAGRPGMGKTVVAMNIADTIAHPRHRNGGLVVVFSLEMAGEQQGPRQLAAASGVNLESLIVGGMRPEDWDGVTAGVGKLSELDQITDFRPGLSLAQIRAKCRLLKRKRGRLACVVVDYLTLITSGNKRNQNRTNEVGEISRGLKALSKELECPVIALSQLSRKCEERPNKRPLPSDLRESGEIEQDADVILLLYRDEEYNADTRDKGVLEINVAKNRQGAQGVVPVAFMAAISKIGNLSREWQPPSAPAKSHSRGGFEG